IEAALEERLNTVRANWKDETAIGVVLAAAGYPEQVKKGDEISGIDAAEKTGAKVFYASVLDKDGKTVTNGGRVLCVTALGQDIANARQNAYAACEKIKFDGMQMRRDIGNKALNR
ncbi:MAG: phosphoribosylamine--glycine ligase, partial [Neisseriaceae bacterium]|nr:phosphoribosylamine--glycine ligase [Neisseriaceae bacterium]